MTLGHTRGAILLAVAFKELQLAEYTPREIKKAVVDILDLLDDHDDVQKVYCNFELPESMVES